MESRVYSPARARGRAPLDTVLGRPARRCQQRQAAQGDPGQDGRAPGRLGQADRVAEGGGAGDRADEWLHRVAAGQQAGLGHGERGREEQRRQDQPVAGEGRAAAPTGGDQADAGERHREAQPRHRARDLAVPEGGDDRDQHRGGPDEQGPVADAGAAIPAFCTRIDPR